MMSLMKMSNPKTIGTRPFRRKFARVVPAMESAVSKKVSPLPVMDWIIANGIAPSVAHRFQDAIPINGAPIAMVQDKLCINTKLVKVTQENGCPVKGTSVFFTFFSIINQLSFFQ